MIRTRPNPNNFCGGNFFDWLEVYLTEKCNARCSWCIDRNGYHPKHHALPQKIIAVIRKSGKENIIFLGGEPLLYKKIAVLIDALKKKNLFVTTNGSMLSPLYVKNNLIGLKGINISIHHYDLSKNKEITGIKLDYTRLHESIKALHAINIMVRLNCNIIKGYIDSKNEILSYIRWAKELGVNKVRFAELKNDKNLFVDLAKILNGLYGLNENPFIFGCNMDAKIEGMPVNFRQMCGLQTPLRCTPLNPICQRKKSVLYYNGKFYRGWQMKTKSDRSKTKSELIKEVELLRKKVKAKPTVDIREGAWGGGGCQY